MWREARQTCGCTAICIAKVAPQMQIRSGPGAGGSTKSWQVSLPFHSPFLTSTSLPASWPYVYSGKSIIHWWSSRMPEHACQTVGQALEKPEGRLAMNSNWVCYLKSNTSRQVWQMSGGRRKTSVWDVQKSPIRTPFSGKSKSLICMSKDWLTFPFQNHSFFLWWLRYNWHTLY